jgi:excisionase family DNA binding protein
LSVSTKTGYALLKKGSVQHLKVGRSYRIPKAHLLTYLIGFAPGNMVRA